MRLAFEGVSQSSDERRLVEFVVRQMLCWAPSLRPSAAEVAAEFGASGPEKPGIRPGGPVLPPRATPRFGPGSRSANSSSSDGSDEYPTVVPTEAGGFSVDSDGATLATEDAFEGTLGDYTTAIDEGDGSGAWATARRVESGAGGDVREAEAAAPGAAGYVYLNKNLSVKTARETDPAQPPPASSSSDSGTGSVGQERRAKPAAAARPSLPLKPARQPDADAPDVILRRGGGGVRNLVNSFQERLSFLGPPGHAGNQDHHQVRDDDDDRRVQRAPSVRDLKRLFQ